MQTVYRVEQLSMVCANGTVVPKIRSQFTTTSSAQTCLAAREKSQGRVFLYGCEKLEESPFDFSP